MNKNNKKRFDKIYIEITNSCNLNCNFCFNTKRKKQNMDSQQFKHILGEVKNYTNLIMLHVKGEPLLSPYLEEMLEECDKNDIVVKITTNGTLLKERLEILTKAKALKQINISLHTKINEITIDEHLNNIGDSVEKLLSKREDIYVSYRLWNLEDIKENDKNIETLNFLENRYDIKDLSQKAKQTKSLKLKDRLFLNQDIQFTWPCIKNDPINTKGTCYGLRKQIAILASGDVVPCCLDGEGDMVLGNIYEQSIKEILETKRVKEMIDGFEKHELVEPLCKTCGFIKRIN